METRASYVVVGSFVLALFAAALVFVIWLTRTDFEQSPNRFIVYFTGSVTGLQVGSPVRYRGVPVGTVADIRIDPDNVERVRVETDIAAGTPVKTDTIATLGLQGITGVAYIALSGGTRGSPDLKARPGERYPTISATPSGLEQVLAKAPELLERAVTIGERLANLLDERNIGAVSETVEHVRKLSATIAGRSAEIDQILADSRQTLTTLRDASESIAGLSKDLRERVGPIAGSTQDAITDVQVTLADVRRAVGGLAKIADRLDVVIEENRVPLRDFSSGGLYELSHFIAESRVLVAALTRLSSQIERDPARFFFGDSQKGFEAK